ncbi:hypothetical protein C8T65DRAFT_800390 [Cerioporus squamosus]|nr:hypothetical protein C8T65DRAFT_800390 [Cerioporus squamosus]
MATAKVKRALKKANKASEQELAQVAQIGPGRITLKDTEFTARVAASPSLTTSDRNDIWSIYDTNMRALMEPSSLGWNPAEKKEELFHADSRFILIYSARNESAQDTLVAYTMFRFEPGYEDDASVYCYELQVVHGFRGLGLARFLVDKLEIVGRHWHTEKILLTVLKGLWFLLFQVELAHKHAENTAARKAYDRLGFQLDPNSPDYRDSDDDEVSGHEQEEVDYEILSRALTLFYSESMCLRT